MDNDVTREDKGFERVLRSQTNWKELWFYQKSVVLSHLTNASSG